MIPIQEATQQSQVATQQLRVATQQSREATQQLRGGDTTTPGGDTTKKYTVTFELDGGTLEKGEVKQEIEENKLATAPTVTPPTDKEADGWTSSVTSISTPSSPITANVTFTAKWKAKAIDNPDAKDPDAKDPDDNSNNPLAGTAWFLGPSANKPEELIFFSKAASKGEYYFYAIWQPDEAKTIVGNELYIDNDTSYILTLTGNTLKLGKYRINSKGEAEDVEFTRIEGSTKTDRNDVWYTAGTSSTDPDQMILVIKSNNTAFLETGARGEYEDNNYWTKWQYTVDAAGRSRIDWVDRKGVTSPDDYVLNEDNTLTFMKEEYKKTTF
jgi:hypothetical protein